MSGPQVHGARRVRILTATGIPVAAPVAARERFRQMVQPSRRGDEARHAAHGEDDGGRPAPLPALAECLASETGPVDRATAAPRSAAPPASPPPPPVQEPPPHTPAPASHRKSDTADDGDEFGKRIARALMREQRGHTVVEHLAERVAELCNAPQIGAGGSWEFRLNIDPAVLADTSLLLRLGGGRLSLRFDSRDDTARHLVREHRQALAARLAAALQERYEITIDAW